MKSGTQYGIHAEASSQAVPIMRRFHDAGVEVSGILAHENPGLCADAKAISPNILTIARWTNPNPSWEGGQEVAHWPQSEREDFAIKAIQSIFDRTNDDEYQASDYFCAGWNEWDPPEMNADGYRAMAEVFKLTCQEATRRSPEMVARGFHPIKLAIPGFNSGTPEYNEMRAMVDTGLFVLMKARGDILMLHEGVWFDMPINAGYGDRLPGAPSTPPHSGTLCGRFNYWYSLGVQVPFVITEWYDGNRRDTPVAKRLDAMKWMDRLVRTNPYCLGFFPFELTDVQDGPWWLVDFTPVFQSDAMLQDMLAEKDKVNPTGESPMPNVSDTDFAALKAANLVTTTILAKYNNWWEARVPPYTLPAQNRSIQFWHADGTPFAPPKFLNVTWPMNVSARSGNLLLVSDPEGTINDLWVRAADVTP